MIRFCITDCEVLLFRPNPVELVNRNILKASPTPEVLSFAASPRSHRSDDNSGAAPAWGLTPVVPVMIKAAAASEVAGSESLNRRTTAVRVDPSSSPATAPALDATDDGDGGVVYVPSELHADHVQVRLATGLVTNCSAFPHSNHILRVYRAAHFFSVASRLDRTSGRRRGGACPC